MVLEKAAMTNVNHVPENLMIDKVEQDDNLSTASVVNLFKPLPIMVRSLSMFFNWLVTSLCYYGLTMTASTLT